MTSQPQFRFRPEEWNLFESVLNEVLNGFEIPDFEARIGMDREGLSNVEKRLQGLRDGEEITLKLSETRAFRNALFETVKELGVEEFQTRTGHDFDFGNAMIGKLDHLLSDR